MHLLFGRGHQERASFSPGKDQFLDPRTEVIPLAGGHTAKTYYEVSDLWARERLSTRRALLRIIDGISDVRSASDMPAGFQCELGFWLRFVQVEADVEDTLDYLRIWHAQWHEATDRIIRSIQSNDFDHARRSLTERAGPWHYAGWQVDRHIAAVWAQRHA